MKIVIHLIILLVPILGYSQNLSSISELLWSRVQRCYLQFEDSDEDGEPDYISIDDSKNGFLQISGGWPTCGCGCSSTVGAYKNIDNEYIILQTEKENCTWLNRISSNIELTKILPDNFGINGFVTKQIVTKIERPIFFLDIEIPRIGTDTKAKLTLVPFGLYPEGKNLICYEYEEKRDNHKYISGIKEIARKCKDEKTITYLLKGEYRNISKEDMIIINRVIGTDDSRFKSIAEINFYINEIKEVYDIYLQLESTEMILGWDRDRSQFFIKEKSHKPEPINFKEFLANNEFWGLIC